MGLLAWALMGIAIWHFAIFVPDRFWGGIVGSFLLCTLGAILVGFITSGFDVPGGNEIDIATAVDAIPGALLGLGGGVRDRRAARQRAARAVGGGLARAPGRSAAPRLAGRSGRRLRACVAVSAFAIGARSRVEGRFAPPGGPDAERPRVGALHPLRDVRLGSRPRTRRTSRIPAPHAGVPARRSAPRAHLIADARRAVRRRLPSGRGRAAVRDPCRALRGVRAAGA